MSSLASPQPLSEDHEIYMLMLSMLQAGPCRASAALLLREASDHGLLPRGAPSADGEAAAPYSFAELQLRHPCPSDQLRGLLRRVDRRRHQAGSGSMSLLAMHVSEARAAGKGGAEAQVPPLLQQLRRREVGLNARHARRSIERLRPGCAAGLLLGPERFGLRGFVEGHFNAAFCVAFDATGERVITSADDFMIKVWSARSCFLLRSLKGCALVRVRVRARARGRVSTWCARSRGARERRRPAPGAAAPEAATRGSRRPGGCRPFASAVHGLLRCVGPRA